MIDFLKCKSIFEKFILNFDLNNKIIKQRYDHTYRVVDNCYKIAKSLNLSDSDVTLAMLIGLLHDIGRFRQLTIYNSYNDNKSFDHAEYGADMLFKDGLIYDFIDDVSSFDVIEKSIRLHNKACVLDDNIFVKIIRDADKLDILYIMSNDLDELNFYVEPISLDILDNLKNKEVIKYSNIKTTGDKVAVYLGYVFDLNFDFSYNYLVTNNLYKKIYNRLNGKENVEVGFNIVYDFLKERMI